jgi:hypothetical protein
LRILHGFIDIEFKKIYEQKSINMFAEMAKQSTLYSYHELKVATRDFHLDNKLGEGNYGVVYKVSSFFYTMYTHNHLCIILCMNSIIHSNRLFNFHFHLYLHIGWKFTIQLFRIMIYYAEYVTSNCATQLAKVF